MGITAKRLAAFLGLLCLSACHVAMPIGPARPAMAQTAGAAATDSQGRIAYIQRHAVPLGPGGKVPAAMLAQLAPYRAILIGELHGTAELPALTLEVARGLLASGRKVVLGLEIPDDEQARIDRYRQTGDGNLLRQSPFFTRTRQEGRSSQAMARLIRESAGLPGLSLVCLDSVEAESAQDRDTRMANHAVAALRARPGAVLVTLTGNVHSRLSAGTEWDPTYRPMGYEFRQHKALPIAREAVLAVNAQVGGGSAWMSLSKGGGIQALGMTHTPYTQALPGKSYFLLESGLQDGHNGALFMPEVQASSPFGV